MQNMTNKIRIRPSSLANFISCPYQWYNVFILGKRSIPNARAAIGTAIHKGAEVLWSDAIHSGKVDNNLTKLTDASVAEFDSILKEEDINFDGVENANTARLEIIKGTNAFVEDIVPFTPIPTAVEKRFTVKLDHSMVEDISGTLDYIDEVRGVIGDVKTSKRAITASAHTLQQSIYKILATENGIDVRHNLIQGVVLKKEPVGTIQELDTNVAQAKFITNSLLDTLDVLHTGKVDPMILFRGNPKHYLCSDKYCSLRPTCPFVKGEI